MEKPSNMLREMKKDVENKVKNLCEDLGYAYKQSFFVKEDYPNIKNALYFTYLQDKKAAKVSLNITVFISLADLEIIKKQLLDVNSKTLTFTLSQNLSFLMSDKNYFEWTFDGTNDGAMLENLKKCILSFAQPYFDKLNSYDKIISSIENRTERLLNKDFNFYMPIIFLLKGQFDKGIDFITSVINEMTLTSSIEDLQKKYNLSPALDNQIFRAGHDKVSLERLEELVGTLQEITIVGGALGGGKIDPTYLLFARNYMNYYNERENLKV